MKTVVQTDPTKEERLTLNDFEAISGNIVKQLLQEDLQQYMDVKKTCKS